jgi:hypothetical protein
MATARIYCPVNSFSHRHNCETVVIGQVMTDDFKIIEDETANRKVSP